MWFQIVVKITYKPGAVVVVIVW